MSHVPEVPCGPDAGDRQRRIDEVAKAIFIGARIRGGHGSAVIARNAHDAAETFEAERAKRVTS